LQLCIFSFRNSCIAHEILENRPAEANRKSDKKKKMESDWTHITKEAGAIEKTALDWNPQGYTQKKW
jgi:hypothetical protein